MNPKQLIERAEPHSRGSGTETGYKVEARYNFNQAVKISDFIIDNRWRQIDFPKATNGVPQAPFYQRHTLEHGYLSYAAAQALRWWLHAEAESDGGGLCLETRIVKYKIAHSYEITRVAEHMRIGGDDRSNCIPDWGKAEQG